MPNGKAQRTSLKKTGFACQGPGFTCIDTFSNVDFANFYNDKTVSAAADFLNDKALLFFDEEQMQLLWARTDRGTEYGGKLEQHPHQLFSHLNDIDHSRTKARDPQANSCTVRLSQVIQEKFYPLSTASLKYFEMWNLS